MWSWVRRGTRLWPTVHSSQPKPWRKPTRPAIRVVSLTTDNPTKNAEPLGHR